MPVSERTYVRLELEDPEGQWELRYGQLVQKPVMTYEHNEVTWTLGVTLQNQLGRERYTVRVNSGRTHRPEVSCLIPDVMVIPRSITPKRLNKPLWPEAYTEPLPLVVEVWSRSTGRYDARTKLPDYQARGDMEIWYIHPYERTLTAWRWQPDGTYTRPQHHGGVVEPLALPGVRINLDELFEV
jgi:Uma2 family endonuclease